MLFILHVIYIIINYEHEGQEAGSDHAFIDPACF